MNSMIRALGPILSLSILFSCGGGGGTDSLNATGDTSQQNPLIVQPESGSPADTSESFDESSFLLTTNESSLFKVSPITGDAQLVWSSEFDFSWSAPADVIGNRAYLTANDNSINSINLDTGEFLWEVPIGQIQNPDFADWPTAAVCDDSTCWVRGSTGLLMAVNAENGGVLWSTALHPNGDSNEELTGSELLVTEDKIYLTVHDSPSTFFPEFVDPFPVVVDRGDGSILKSIDLPYVNFAVPRLIDNRLVVTTSGEILVFDATTYEVLWRVNEPTQKYINGPVIGDVVVVNMLDGSDQYVVGYDLVTGALRWSVDAGHSDGISGSTTDGQLIYAMVGKPDSSAFFTPGGREAMAINPENGTVVWKSDFARIVSNPLVVFGKAFYGYFWDVGTGVGNDGLTGMNALTGTVEWVNNLPGLDWRQTTPMLVHNGGAYRSSKFPDAP